MHFNEIITYYKTNDNVKKTWVSAEVFCNHGHNNSTRVYMYTMTQQHR